jgi:DNA-binding NarL/FixJ family response regulator
MAPLILIADALDEYRLKLQKALSSHFPSWRIEATASMDDLVQTWKQERPAAVLLDESLKSEKGARPALDMKEAVPETLLILMSAYDDEHIRQAASKVGVDGVVNKMALEEKLFPLLASRLGQQEEDSA